MNQLLQFLTTHEPTISAVVGLCTLVAALWGFVQFALVPLLAGTPLAVEGQPAAAEVPRRSRIWASLIDRGVNPGADLIEQVATRTLNACLLFVIAATLIWLVATLLSGEVLILSIANFIAFLVAVSAYNLLAAGYQALARWLFIAGLALYWGFNIVVMGSMIGLEYFLGGVLVLPLLIFQKEERRQLAAAVTVFALALPASLFIEAKLDFTRPESYADIVPGYYYVNAIVLALLVFLILYAYNRSADESFSRLEDQKQKSEELIHRIVPAYIAEKMADRSSTVADWHSEASVLFATVHGFENLYQRVSAVQLVELLSQLFSQFDELLLAQGVEKINTLGTNYVAVTGLDPQHAGSHGELARVAMGMREVVRRMGATVDHPFSLSVGISTGDVVSGVIGDARPSFDVWGKTVELANTMRGSALADAIVVNEAAYWRLRDRFIFEPSESDGSVYLLLGAKEDRRADD